MSDYAGQTIALLTQHGKETVIAPVLEPILGCVVQRIDGYDTDQLGTFTRDTPRPGTQLEAARRKARVGMELSGLPVGLASEGSFGPDPFTGLFPWNVEMLVWIDDRLGIEVVGMAQGPAQGGHVQTGDWAAVEAFAEEEGFPAHQLVMRPQDQDDPRLLKGIADWDQLKQGFDTCLAQSSNAQVFVELDLRAFANPTRMARIAEAAQDLLKRLQSPCPACQVPGFWITERQPGLTCSSCGQPTQIHKAEVWQCPGCQHRVVEPRQDRRFADPQHCARCNP
ncbi:MAG: hypothetical protein KGI91_11570 [Burkholderiales bacterium]|nr:hypothetical protein [Burkholderiales bacterium]MDE2432956.1 hypothetical protein [Burkholderiales bacterium]